jgi:hypothetical protein
MSRCGEFLHEIRGLHRLRAGPRIVSVVSVGQHYHAHRARAHRDESREKKAQQHRDDAAIYFHLQRSPRYLSSDCARPNDKT